MSESAAFRSSAESLDQLDVARFTALDRLTPALLVVDVQHDFAAPEAIGAMCETPQDLANVAAAVERIGQLVEAARASGVPVVWIQLETSHETWTVNNWLRNGSRSIPLGDHNPCVRGTAGAEWYGVTPAPGEVVVPKDSYSGFFRTNLKDELDELGVDWVVVTGLTTECCVFSTANDAMQHDYPVVVPDDACASYGASFHASALATMALNSAMVSTTETVAAYFASSSKALVP